jgi:hypothetical protein
MNNEPTPSDRKVSFQDQVDNLSGLLEQQCDKFTHAGATVVALIQTLCTQMHQMIESNGMDRKDTIKQVQSDIMDCMKELNNDTFEGHDFLSKSVN